MTPNKQVSPVIRISQGERDASARATHLEAATRKFLVTTNERKYMSTKTNFKRIALVAVAALGLGLLSSTPSSAATVAGTQTLTVVSAGTATKAKSDSTTSAKIVVEMLATASTDSFTLSVTNKSKPDLATSTPTARFYVVDTVGTTAGNPGTLKPSALYNSDTAYVVAAAATGYTKVKFGVFMDSGTPTRVAGTYVYTVIADFYSALGVSAQKSADVTITIAALTSESTVADPVYSTAIMSEGASFVSGTTIDSTIALSAEASATDQAVIKVTLRNASNTTDAAESLTVTTTAGVVGTSAGVYGRSITLAYSGATDLLFRTDGTSGTAVITIAAKSFTFPTKSIVLYGDAATITAGSYSSVIGTSGIGVWGSAKDSKGNDLASGTALYAYSSDTSVISSYGSACGSYDSTLKVVACTLTGVKAGTANITLRDAATVALSTVASSAVAVRVSQGTATSYKVTTSATSFAPGQPGVVLVTVYDADGKVMPAGEYANLFSSTGITPSMTMGGTLNGTLSSASVTTAANPVASATKPVVSTDPVMQYYYYMPTTGGTLTFSHKGGTSLPTAAQVSGTSTVTITDNAAAALAAVTALATTVASLKTLITTLTNLVLKIQKKVKA